MLDQGDDDNLAVGKKSVPSLSSTKKKKPKTGCIQLLKYADAFILKPMFLYNYDSEGHKRIK